MTREIKFRAWTNRDKCWVGAFAVHMSGLWRESPNNEWTDLSKQDEIVLMQYTGLKDKNGKEIYEHDRVEYKGVVYTIRFEFGAFYLDHDTEDNLRLPNPAYPELFEIKGNIYENPELLK